MITSTAVSRQLICRGSSAVPRKAASSTGKATTTTATRQCSSDVPTEKTKYGRAKKLAPAIFAEVESAIKRSATLNPKNHNGASNKVKLAKARGKLMPVAARRSDP